MAKAGSPAPDSHEETEAIAVWETEGDASVPKPADRDTNLNNCRMKRFIDGSRDQKLVVINIVDCLWRERSK